MNDAPAKTTLSALLARLWRRRAWIAAGVVAATVITGAAAMIVPPVYTAHAEILIENAGASTVATEREVLRSRGIALAAVADLKLMDDPAFNPAVQDGSLEREKGYKGVSVHRPAQPDAPAGVMDRALGDITEKFRARLAVAATPGTGVLRVSYSDPDAARAALGANRVAALYLERRLAAQMDSQAQVSQWSADRLEKLRAAMAAADEKLIAFRRAHKLPDDSAPAPPAIIAEALAAAPQAPMLAEYRAHDAALRVKIADLSKRYGEKHPKMIAARAALAESQKRLRAAGVPAKDLPPAESQKTERLDAAAQAQLAALTRDARAARQMFDSFLATHTALQTPPATALAIGARLISPAVIPAHPAWPPLRRWLMLSAAGSFVLLCLLALIAGQGRRAFRTAQEIEDHTGLPCYALVPSVADDGAGTPAADLILSPGAHHAAESLRSLRAMTMLRAAEGAERPRVIAITSSYPGEGKSTLAAWLARTAAKSGERVIVVDCDMRRPALHKAFGAVRGKTLCDYLDNDAKLEDVVHTGDPGGVHMIFAASVPARALELLAGERLHRLIAALRKTYDLVILDAPACMAVTDPLLLARQADLTLYNVVWNDTPRHILDTALRLFAPRDRERLALVVNKVDVHNYAAYGYGDVRYDYTPASASA